MNKSVDTFLVVISLVIFTSCSKQDITLRIGLVSSEVTSVDPYDSSNARISMVMDNVYDFLFYTFGTGEVYNRLTEDAYLEDDTLIVRIKPSIYFHDNSVLTSEDIIYTFNHTKKNPGNITYQSLSNYVESVDAVDDRTVKIKFAGQVPIDSSMLAHIPIIKKSEKLNTLVGVGPYRLQSLQPKSIILKKFDHYYQSHTGPETIECKLYNDYNELLKALILKEIDFSSSLYFSDEDIKMVTDSGDYHLKPYIPPFCSMIIFNTTSAIFQSKLTRKALSLAIDRESIVKNILKNKGIAAYSPIYLKTGNSNLNHEVFNIQKSHDLLQSDGWIFDIDKRKYVDSDGNPFVFELLCEDESVFMTNTALNLRQQLKIIGIEMNVIYGSMQNNTAKMLSGDFDAVFIGLRSDINTNSLYQLWHSDSIENGLNLLNYRNDEVDRLIEKLTIELPTDGRLPIYGQLEQAFLDDPPAVFLFYREQYLMISNQYSITIPHPQKWFHFIHQWDIRRN